MPRALLFVFFIVYTFVFSLTIILVLSPLSWEAIRPILWLDLAVLVGSGMITVAVLFRRRYLAWRRLRRMWKAKRSQLSLREVR